MRCSLIPYQVGESGLVDEGNAFKPKGLWFKPYWALDAAFRSNLFMRLVVTFELKQELKAVKDIIKVSKVAP